MLKDFARAGTRLPANGTEFADRMLILRLPKLLHATRLLETVC